MNWRAWLVKKNRMMQTGQQIDPDKMKRIATLIPGNFPLTLLELTPGYLLVTQSCLTLWLYGLWHTRLLCPWDSPGKNPGVGSQALLQGIFLTQRLNSGLLHCRQICYCQGHQGNQNSRRPSHSFDLGGSWSIPKLSNSKPLTKLV